eukprot:gene38574-43709_t
MDKTDLKYQEEEQESYTVVAAEVVEPAPLGVAAADANQQAKNVITEDDEALALSDDFIRTIPKLVSTFAPIRQSAFGRESATEVSTSASASN